MTTSSFRELGRELARGSRAAQGLPATITDPAVLGRVAAIIGWAVNPPGRVPAELSGSTAAAGAHRQGAA